jgi:cysteine desulfurase
VIYLDHHAATPLLPAAARAMEEVRSQAWANPSSVHGAGRASRALLERARDRVAAAIGAAPADLVLTAGGTEACNLGVIGGALAAVGGGAASSPSSTRDGGSAPGVAAGWISATRIEHPAVTEAISSLAARFGFGVRWIDVPRGVAPRADALDLALDEAAAAGCLAILQWVNHETGTVLPVRDYAARCRARGVRLFVDATQALGKIPVDVEALGADYVAFASHKVGGPAGAGALWVRRGAPLESLSLGGAQERGRRAGTPDVVAQVGFGAACENLAARLGAQARIAALRDRIEATLLELGAVRNADAGERVSTVTNVWFPSLRSDVLVAALDVEGVAASSGAACSSGKSEPSPVLLAMHPDEPQRATGSIRFSFGPETSETDIDFAITAIRKVLTRQRR